jgi:hypothetical protein
LLEEKFLKQAGIAAAESAARGADLWAGDLVKPAGEYIDYVAIHMGMGARRQDTVLRELSYEKEPERAWLELLGFSNIVENRVSQLEDAIAGAGSRAAIAITEAHLGH